MPKGDGLYSLYMALMLMVLVPVPLARIVNTLENILAANMATKKLRLTLPKLGYGGQPGQMQTLDALPARLPDSIFLTLTLKMAETIL